MLHQLITRERQTLIARARERVAARHGPLASTEELRYGVPILLDQIAAALVDPAVTPEASGLLLAAGARQGFVFHNSGFTVSQVVHGYGDICQAITEVAQEQAFEISTYEFQKLNFCLDEAIAGAVTTFVRLREDRLESSANERIGALAHEVRNLVHTATLSFEMMRPGTVPVGGSTGAILGRSLSRLGALVSRSLAEVRIDSGVRREEHVSIGSLLEETEIAASMDASARGLHLIVTAPVPDLDVVADRQVLGSALDNLVQNAIKFTPPGGHIEVTVRVAGDRVVIEIADECGGLPKGDGEALFSPFEQRDANRSGVGLGLAIARKGLRAMGGDVRARDVPGAGCVFTVEVPCRGSTHPR